MILYHQPDPWLHGSDLLFFPEDDLVVFDQTQPVPGRLLHVRVGLHIFFSFVDLFRPGFLFLDLLRERPLLFLVLCQLPGQIPALPQQDACDLPILPFTLRPIFRSFDPNAFDIRILHFLATDSNLFSTILMNFSGIFKIFTPTDTNLPLMLYV